MPPTDLQTLLAMFLRDLYAGTVSFTGSSIAITGSAKTGDGTALLPAYSFTSEATLGFWRSGAGAVTLQGALTTTGGIIAGGNITTPGTTVFAISGRLRLESPANGVATVANNGDTIGSNLKVDALPTVASGFGGSPAITAGSTPLAGSVDVGTGGAATSGVINFNGTAFPSAPFVVATNKTTNAVVRATASTTQLTLSSTTAWGANDIVTWHAISSK